MSALVLTWQDYVPLAGRTAKPMETADQVNHAILGMITEVGELADHYKRVWVYGKSFDRANFMEEIGDVCWYVALMAATLKYDLHTTASHEGDYPVGELKLIKDLAWGVGNICNAPATAWSLQGVIRKLQKLCALHDVDFWACLGMNIAKLAKRYGDKYSDQAALVRDLIAERELLEQTA